MESLAQEFSRQVPEAIFTPAQLQGYLLGHRFTPVEAVQGVRQWIEDDKARKAAVQADAETMKAWEKKQGDAKGSSRKSSLSRPESQTTLSRRSSCKRAHRVSL